MADPDHVKIPDARPRIKHTADGYQTTFPFTFPLMDETHLAVYLNETRQSSGFDVIGERETDGGVVFFSQAPAADTIVTLVREVPIERLTDFQENIPIQTRVLNDEFDVFTTALQDVAEGVRRSISLKSTDTDADLQLPSKYERASKLLGFDGNGNAIATMGSSGGGNGNDPGGADTHVQFNDGGLFAGTGDLTYTKATNTLSVGGGINTDALSEKTTDAGVTIEGVVIKDVHVDGRSLAVDGSKLDGIEVGATADQSGAEIKNLYEAEADTNAFTDSDKAKLAGIESGASVDMTGAEIKKAYEGEVDTNAFTDTEKAKLAVVENGATADQTGSEIVSAIDNELGGTTWQTGGGVSPGGGIKGIPLQVPTFADLASPPKYKYINGLPFQFFEEGDAVKWPVHVPEGFGPSPVLKVLVAMETANSGTLSLAASVDAISPMDSQVVSAETYDTANNAVVAVPSTPETLTEVSIPLTSSDNLGVGDIARLKLERSTGTAPGGMWLLCAALTSGS